MKRYFLFFGLALALLVPTAALAASLHHHRALAAHQHKVSRTFASTYPYANALCRRATAGKLGKKLTADTSAVKSDCVTLHSAFTTAKTTLQGQVKTLKSEAKPALQTYRGSIKAARKTARQAVKVARQSHNRAAVVQAVKTYHSSIKAARQTVKTSLSSEIGAFKVDRKAAVTSLEAARKVFWTNVHQLRGLSNLPADAPVTQS